MDSRIEIYVSLLEEGTPTWRPTQAINLGNGSYQLLPTENYDPEDETWEFEPGTVVRGCMQTSYKGDRVLVAMRPPETREQILKKHPGAPILKITVKTIGKRKQTEGVDMGNGLYKLLPTPDYDLEKEPWEFSPGSVVRVTKVKDSKDNDILLAFDQIREDRMDEEYATLVRK